MQLWRRSNPPHPAATADSKPKKVVERLTTSGCLPQELKWPIHSYHQGLPFAQPLVYTVPPSPVGTPLHTSHASHPYPAIPPNCLRSRPRLVRGMYRSPNDVRSSAGEVEVAAANIPGAGSVENVNWRAHWFIARICSHHVEFSWVGGCVRACIRACSPCAVSRVTASTKYRFGVMGVAF
jgi:hypothetical protein